MPGIEFRGYSGDCLIQGILEVPEGTRLTDFLNRTQTHSVRGATLHALDDGRTVSAGDQELDFDELWAIEPTDGAGSPEMHLPTRAVEVVLEIGPYTVSGYLHGLPNSDPLAALHRRKPMIPLTEATIEFVFAGRQIKRESGVLIVNRDAARSIARIEYQKSPLDELDLPPADPRAIDLTGAIRTDAVES